MANESLKHSFSSSNHSLNPCDIFNENLDRAYALVRVALSEEFSRCDQLVIHNYLSLLDDLILNMRQVLKEVSQKIDVD